MIFTNCAARLITILFFAFAAANANGETPPLVSGVWKQGHNIMEPRPKSSKFMKIIDAGFLVSRSQEAYRVEIEISPNLATPYFMQAFFENARDSKKPFTEEAIISEPKAQCSLTHGPVKGLRIGRDYRITVKIFRRQGDAQPLDVLVQSVRSYLDTTGAVTRLKGGMRAR